MSTVQISKNPLSSMVKKIYTIADDLAQHAHFRGKSFLTCKCDSLTLWSPKG